MLCSSDSAPERLQDTPYDRERIAEQGTRRLSMVMIDQRKVYDRPKPKRHRLSTGSFGLCLLLLQASHLLLRTGTVGAFSVPHRAEIELPSRRPMSRSQGDEPTTDDDPVATPSVPSTDIPTPASQTATEPTLDDMMRALETSPRRIFLSTLSATGIALAGNLFGVTSNLLSLAPEDLVEASRLDTYFPRGDFKRVRTNGYSFLIPREWVADTSLELAKAQQRARSLDYGIPRQSSTSLMPDAGMDTRIARR